jgi:CheY-like chemotaxis protein
MRVLVVDDGTRYRVYLSARLASLGHEVAVAGAGAQAIEQGLRFLPDVIVCDWMLRDSINGLQVIEALRAVNAGLAAILITGFASRDLRAQARAARVVDFLEKPFGLDDLVACVERAGSVPKRRRPPVPFGVLVMRGELCVHASERAREMLRSTLAGRSPGRLEQIFDEEDRVRLAAGEREWSLVLPRSRGRVRWWAHWTRRDEDGVIGILPHRKRFLRSDARLRLLLSLERTAHRGLPAGRLLVLDPTPIGEVRYPEQLERLGWSYIKADSPRLALRLLEEDPQVDVVVIERAAFDSQLADFVQTVRQLWPRAVLVGASPRLADERDFAGVRLDRFLHSPWRVGDLLHLLDS